MRRVAWIVVLAVVAVAVWLGRGWARRTVMTMAPDRPECGHEWPKSVIPESVALVDGIDDIPEYHDCQHFIVQQNGGLAYGPLAAIFARSDLGSILNKLATTVLVVPPGGATTNITVPGQPPRPPGVVLPPGTQRSAEIPIGIIYAGGEYAPLSIKTHLNCLYISFQVSPIQDTTWTAHMVRMGDASDCPEQPAGGLDGHPRLAVHRTAVIDPTTNMKFADADYPKVARWDWDPDNKQQYIGIYCAQAWCEISDTLKFSPSPALPPPQGGGSDAYRVRMIKGWYDQQFLAGIDANGDLYPSGVIGTIVPDPKLDDKNDESQWNGRVDLADVLLASTSSSDQPVLDAYKQRFGFEKRPDNKPARIWVKPKAQSTAKEQEWPGGVDPPGGGAEKQKKVTYRERTDVTKKVPGSARWRWMAKDEGTWTRCKYGCCEIGYY